MAKIIPPQGIRIPTSMDLISVSLDTQSELNWISDKVIQKLQLSSLVSIDFKPPDIVSFNGVRIVCLGVINLRWTWHPDGTSVYGPVDLYVSELDHMDMVIGKRTIVSEGLILSHVDIMAPLLVHKKATLCKLLFPRNKNL